MIRQRDGIPMIWSLADLMPAGDKLHILDVGAAFLEDPPYQALVDAGKARISGFEPDQHEREKLQQKYGDSHVFYPYLFNGNVCQPQIKQIFPFQPTFSYSNMASSKVFSKNPKFQMFAMLVKT